MAPKSKPQKKTTKSTVASGSNAIEKQQQFSLQWPSFSTLMPASDLELAPLLPDQILTISNFWTFNLCKEYVKFLAGLPLTTTPGKPKRGEAARVNDRFQLDDPDFAERLWSGTALKELILGVGADEQQRLWGGKVLGLNSNIRIYRYSQGQFFDQHYDDANNVTFLASNSQSPIPARTTWTLLLYLTSPKTGCKGGETVFYPDPTSRREAAPPPIVADLEVGMALLHRHGNDCLLHEGREVTQGEKWVIRSDLCVKR
ncbi:hypothetical protein K431DRAFT_280341 [Polychaeton citri CBS 116435]|uniref:Fe2OG dioxygenase domain-containing protein n=1 Tax=Polychaeton citri CBS 116435 TaxID=1314669 RepID=A0A9P4QIR7_9PEZI|nr:hypothetical protein K431DRAFT_280341 [Polychaeton citri CBS 116435]